MKHWTTALGLALVMALSAGAQDVKRLPPLKGPRLDSLSSKEYRAFKKTLPAWFVKNFAHDPEYSWGKHTDQKGFFPSGFWVETVIEKVKRDGKCWSIEKARIFGWESTIRYGTEHVKLAVGPAASLKMLNLYNNAFDLWQKNTLKEVVDSQDKSILLFLAEQVPVAGEILEKGSSILSTGNLANKLNQLQKDLKEFQDEYKQVRSKLGKTVATVKGGYDNAVILDNERKEIDSVEKRTEVKREGFQEGQDELGVLAVQEKNGEVLLGILNKDKDERDYSRFLESVYSQLDVWVGRWDSSRGNLEITRSGATLKVDWKSGTMFVESTTDGTKISGRWSDKKGAKGKFSLNNEDGVLLRGRFSRKPEEEPTHSWDGVRSDWPLKQWYEPVTDKDPRDVEPEGLEVGEYNRGSSELEPYDRGIKLYNAGDLAGAREQFKKVLEIDAKHARAHYYLGLCLISTEENSAAKQHLRRFLELAPDDPEAQSAKQMLEFLD